MWTELAQAYESRLGVLEEARAEYRDAVAGLISQVGSAMEGAVSSVLGNSDVDYSLHTVIAESGDDAVFALAPWSCITMTEGFAGTEFRIAAWIASSWGGPLSTLRVALSVQGLHSALDPAVWISKCAERVDESVPGEPFNPFNWMQFPEASPDWRAVRIASIELAGRDFPEVAHEAGDVAIAFAETIDPLLKLITEAVLPTMNAENALLEYRPTLEARAHRAGVPMSPLKGIASWRGGKYLQVGDFWLASDPAGNRLVASCNKQDRDVLSAVADMLDQPVGDGGTVTVLGEDELRNPGAKLAAAVSSAFDLWFDTKAEELSSSDNDQSS